MSSIHLKRAAIVVGTLVIVGCAGPSPERPSPTNRDSPRPQVSEKPQTPEEQRQAIQKARAEEAEHVKKLAAAVQAESRNDAWAAPKEQELKTSYASSGNPRGALKSVECRSTKCDLQLELPTSDRTDSPAGPVAAVNQWIAASQPCGYTVFGGEALERGPAAIRIVIDCAQPSPKDD